MRSIINFAVIFSLASILAGYASARDPGASLSSQDVARLMAVKDNLIVPGVRIGPVFIGMTETQLYQKLSDPSQTVRGNDGTWIRYSYSSLGLGVQVNPSTHRVNVVDNFLWEGNLKEFPYSTREGITVGSSELQIQILPWKLLWKRQESSARGCWTFQYTGIRIHTCNGNVNGIDVHSPN
jgi:hypothetical protein